MLGLLTIASYGAWYYAFGVLLDPILDDTGWAESTLAATFSGGTILIGVGSIIGGRLLDAFGTTPLFLTAATIGGSGFVAASFATDVYVFAVGSVVGMALFGALGFYHVTMTAAIRVNADAPARAIAVLTIWGALSSAIYVPGTAWLVEVVAWRSTIRILAASTIVMFVIASLVIRVPPDPSPADRVPLLGVLAATVRDPVPRLFTLAIAMGGIAISTMLVYQVPAMSAAGLPLTTAASMAGIRGVAQLGGRLPLTPLVEMFGANGALLVAFGAITGGGLLLTQAGSVPVALVFAVVAGFGIGAFSPLHGIKATEIFDARTMGATLGIFAAVQMVAGAAGPALTGVLAHQTGDRRFAGVIIAVAGAVGMACVWRLGRASLVPTGSSSTLPSK